MGQNCKVLLAAGKGGSSSSELQRTKDNDSSSLKNSKEESSGGLPFFVSPSATSTISRSLLGGRVCSNMTIV